MMINYNINENEKRKFIQKIYDQNWMINNPHQAIYGTNNFDTVSFGMYSDNSRFLVELIQNCDDSSFESNNLEITFTILEDAIMISHQGKAFDENDIMSLCSSGTSTKLKNAKLTGYKGIGFKSVFYNSEKVAVVSNGYQFKFDKEYFTPEKCWQNEWGDMTKEMETDIKKPWHIIPIWVEESEIGNEIFQLTKRFNVNILIFFNKKDKFEMCKGFINDLEKDPLHFLFLKSKNIKLTIKEKNNKDRELTKFEYSKHLGITALKTDITENCSFYYVKGFDAPLPEFTKEEKEILNDDRDFPKKLLLNPTTEIAFAVSLKEVSRDNYKVNNLPQEKRLIYCFLPTKQNFNFPFLINSNFILDSSRTQIKENHLWNEAIFSLLPGFINKFVEEFLFEKFGNSYAMCLLSDINITIPKYKEKFSESNKKFEKTDNLIKTMASKKPLNKCYYNNFRLKIGDKIIDEIDTFFFEIYGMYGPLILEDYFSDKVSLDYNTCYEIPKEDIEYIYKLSKFYKQTFYTITEKELISFLKSKQFIDRYNPDICFKYISKIASSNLLTEFKNSSASVFKDKEGILRTAAEVYVCYSLSEENQKIFTDLIKDQFKKSELSSELRNLFAENDINILKQLGVTILNESDYIDNVLNYLNNIYCKETSISLIRIIFKNWVAEINHTVKESFIKKIANLHYLTEDDDFCHVHAVNIGTFYNINQFPSYHRWAISSKYYYEGSSKDDWLEFFKKIGFTYENKVCKKIINLEILNKIPFFDDKYVEIIKRELLTCTKDEYFTVEVYPNLVQLYGNASDEEVNTYFYKHFKNYDIEVKIGRKRNFIPNFLVWYTLYFKKMIPTNKNVLKNVDNVYSKELLENEAKGYISFEKKKVIYDLLREGLYLLDEKLPEKINEQKVVYNTNLKFYDRILLMNSIIKKCQTRSNDKEVVKDYFMELLAKVSIEKPNEKIENINFLDVEDEFRSPSELYYVEPQYSSIISDQIRNTLKRIKIPPKIDEKNLKEFLKFCKNNGVKIYSKENVSVTPSNEKSDESFMEHLIKINFPKYLSLIIEKNSQNINTSNNSNSNITERDIQTTLNKLKLLQCSNILLNYEQDSFGFITYLKQTPRTFQILYLKNDVYSSWRHPTIVYFISKYLARIFNNTNLSHEINTLLRSENEVEILQWIAFGCSNNF